MSDQFSTPAPRISLVGLPPLAAEATPDPRDRLSGYAIGWLAWVAAFAALEAYALRQDARHHDRVKRTLSSNVRYVFATDSVTGIPLAVKHGKLRRLALITAEGWLTHHFARQGEV